MDTEFQKRPVRRLILLRKYKGFSQAQIAEVCEISIRTYQRIEYEEVDLPVRALLQIAERLKVDPTFFFKENDYGTNVDLSDLARELPESSDSAVRELFKNLHSSVEFLLNETEKKRLEKLSKVHLDRVEYSASARAHLGIAEHSYFLKDHARLEDQQVQLGHEFMLQNGERVVIRHCRHHFGSSGQIETVNVAKCARSSLDNFYSYVIPHKVGHLTAEKSGVVDELLAGLKFFYQNRVLIMKASHTTVILGVIAVEFVIQAI